MSVEERIPENPLQPILHELDAARKQFDAFLASTEDDPIKLRGDAWAVHAWLKDLEHQVAEAKDAAGVKKWHWLEVKAQLQALQIAFLNVTAAGQRALRR